MLAPMYEIVRGLLSIAKACFPKSAVPKIPIPPWDGWMGPSPTDPFRSLLLIAMASVLLFVLRFLMTRLVPSQDNQRALLMHGRALPVTITKTEQAGRKYVTHFHYWLDGKELQEKVTHHKELGRVGASLTLLLSHDGKRQVLYELMDYELLK